MKMKNQKKGSKPSDKTKKKYINLKQNMYLEHQNNLTSDMAKHIHTKQGFFNPLKYTNSKKSPRQDFRNAKLIKQEWLNKAIEGRKTSEFKRRQRYTPQKGYSLRNMIVI